MWTPRETPKNTKYAHFVELVRAHSPELLRTAYLLTGDAAYAENLVRAALIRAYLAGASSRCSQAPEVFVRRAIVTMVMSRWWTPVWRRSRPELEEPPVDAARPRGEEAAERDRLWEGLRNLSGRQRVLIVSQYHDGLSVTETAELTGSTVEAVRVRTAQVLESLHGHGEGDRPNGRWRDVLEGVVRPGAVEKPADRVGRLLRDLFAERVAEVEVPVAWDEQILRDASLVRRTRVTAPVTAVAMVLVAVVAGLVGPGLDRSEKPPATPTTATAEGLRAVLERLPVGPAPGVPYAVGRTIVLAPDRAVELPSGYRNPGLFGMGGSRDGLLVVPPGVIEGGMRAVHIAGDGSVTQLEPMLGSYAGHVVSPDGRYAAWTTRSGSYDEPAFAKIVDLRTGKLIANRELPRSLSAPTNEIRVPRIHAFDGEQALVVGSNAAGKLRHALWHPADNRLERRRTPAGFRTIWASSLSTDTLLATVEDALGHRCLVNVAVSDPERERWRLCDGQYVPYLSPDANLVALRRIEDHARDPANTLWDHRPISLVVRDLDTGDVVSRHRIDAPRASLWAPAWESDEALLVSVQDSAYQTRHLLRCPVLEDESCEHVPIPGDRQVTAIAVQRSP